MSVGSVVGGMRGQLCYEAVRKENEQGQIFLGSPSPPGPFPPDIPGHPSLPGPFLPVFVYKCLQKYIYI